MIDYQQLKEICQRPINNFKDIGKITDTPDGIYIHKNNNSNVLAVAHLDTVENSKKFQIKHIKGHKIIRAPQLDDRLGAYIILKILPKLGVNVDILLTEGEEIGRSTAAYFEADKQYNWMFSFDRDGEDVVLYEFDSRKFRKRLRGFDFEIGAGSFSDIYWLEELNCKGVNIGCGYHNNHSLNAFAIESQTIRQVNKFVNFYNQTKDTHLSHKKKAHNYFNDFYGYCSPHYDRKVDYSDYTKCSYCEEYFVEEVKLLNKFVPLFRQSLCRSCEYLTCDVCGSFLISQYELDVGTCDYCEEKIPA